MVYCLIKKASDTCVTGLKCCVKKKTLSSPCTFKGCLFTLSKIGDLEGDVVNCHGMEKKMIDETHFLFKAGFS